MSESLFLDREALLVQDALKVEKVQLSRGHVFVREMTAYEKNIWEQSMLRKVASGNPNQSPYETNLDNFRMKLAVNVICDEAGNLLFTMKDVNVLSKSLSAANLEAIVDKAQELNAITADDKKEMVKNLEAGKEEDSNSISAEN